MNSFLKNLRIEPKTLATDIIYDIIGSVLYGAGLYNFAYTANFAPGGVSGLSMLINILTSKIPFFQNTTIPFFQGGISIGLAMILVNIPIIFFCFKALGPEFFFRSVKTILISSLIVDHLMPHLWTYQGSPMLAAIFGGVLAGAGLSCIYMRDSSTGGSDFVILAIQKKNPHLSIGRVSLAVDGVVILLGGIVYGTVDAALYGLLMTITYSLIIDKIMLGNDSRKLLTIITTNGDMISQEINEKVSRGVTIINGKGAYTGDSKQILLCACSNAQVYKVKRIVYSMDEKSFIMVSSVDAAFGEGFKPQDVNT